ncbi:hypothetical protein CPB83DRAFT_124114 [Crepidotus variabilis]|uniref:Uncharacterized protein n=1 Tax=Crepidotus variabilis TaxID=179855 RepID=A0A9P6EM61_9AGAR|nr:hypothetical protein CPB83DRAFT_124114 [Crepidotus variabilis]
MFLKRHQINDPMNMLKYFRAIQYPPLLLPLIQAALWIKDIQHVDCGMNAGYDRIWNDVGDLKYLVGKQWPIQTMKLHLRFLDGWASASQRNGNPRALDGVKWVKCVTELLDAVLAQGCLTLEVDGGHSLNRLYVEKETSGMTETADVQSFPTRGQVVRKRLTAFLKQTSAWIFCQPNKTLPDLRPSAAPSGPYLNDVTFSHSMMFQDCFYPWTLQMFAKNSATITHLSFQVTSLPAETFSHFLFSITLPRLGHLKITAHSNQNHLTITRTVKFSEFLAFFERHSSIETLDLQGVERPEAPPILETCLLPQLKQIVAHPVWISTLITPSKSCPDAFPFIESIGITTEYPTFMDPFEEEHVYELINDALWAITRASFPRTITLELQLKTKRGMLDWLDKHSSLGKENSIISSLWCVSTLVLTTRFYVCFGREEIHHLPSWLALFPALKIVNIPDLRQEKDGYRLFDDSPLLRKISVKCPTLEKVESALASIDLSTLLDPAERPHLNVN